MYQHDHHLPHHMLMLKYSPNALRSLKMSALPPTSAVQALTLVDVMRAVPPLLDACIWSWQPHWGAGIRILRLVCKDMPSVALGAIQSFSTQVGNGAFPNPQQMAQILRHSLPLQLDLTVIVKPSEGEWCCLLPSLACIGFVIMMDSYNLESRLGLL